MKYFGCLPPTILVLFIVFVVSVYGLVSKPPDHKVECGLVTQESNTKPAFFKFKQPGEDIVTLPKYEWNPYNPVPMSKRLRDGFGK